MFGNVVKASRKIGVIDFLLKRLLNARERAPIEDGRHTPPDSIVPDEELVIRLLAEYDGYTWQGHIVRDLEWSEPKTSRILSSMERTGRITRYRIGRRNVVCLPDREPTQLRQGHSRTNDR